MNTQEELTKLINDGEKLITEFAESTKRFIGVVDKLHVAVQNQEAAKSKFEEDK